MYDHYIALDWAQRNMAIARMTKHSEKIQVIDVPADVVEMKIYLKQLKGKKILTFEETTTSQWLYTELKDYVEEILVCNPHRNKLLSEGPKTDKIDAQKLVRLLKANLLKPVFHSGSFYFSLRKIVSGYEDVVKLGVRVKNQKSSLLRAVGVSQDTDIQKDSKEMFVLEGINRWIKIYEQEKAKYEKEFSKLIRSNKVLKNLTSIPGIGEIGAVKTAAIVVDPKRFKNKSAWLSFCGLIKLEKMSGGRSYGKKNPQYCRTMKSVMKTAAVAVINKNNESVLKDYYRELINKGSADFNARNAVSRRIAVIALGVFKNNKKFENRWDKTTYQITT